MARPAIEFAALTGLRVIELARLRWDHIDLDRRLVRIERQKNERVETQPVPEAAAAILSKAPTMGAIRVRFSQSLGRVAEGGHLLLEPRRGLP